MQSAGFSSRVIWLVRQFVNKVYSVIRFFSNQTSQNRAQASLTSGQAPGHSKWYREMAEWFIWLSLVSSREEPWPTKVNYLQDGKLPSGFLQIQPVRGTDLSSLTQTYPVWCWGIFFFFFSPSSYFNINASQLGTYATLIIILNRGLYIEIFCPHRAGWSSTFYSCHSPERPSQKQVVYLLSPKATSWINHLNVKSCA